ncbi:MAG: hypothetical protein K2Y05_06650 [Hyphomicrobiaceae bacterium]|nr:hypothetical protein [Hyphomicrobiaceae bacterium]
MQQQRGFEDTSLAEMLTRIEGLVREPVATAGALEQVLGRVYREFFFADFGRFDPRELADGAAPRMQRLFELRLYLRGQISDWAARGWMTRPVQKALRDVFRVTRYASEMLGEAAIGHARLAPGEAPRRAFTGASANTLVNPAFTTGRDLPFQSGDVILVRGQAHNSAAIARIGDIDSQFSHIGIVYVDPNGRPWMVEALIEDGSVAGSLDAALDHGLGRAVLFRHRDAGLAATAAAMIHDHVTNPKRARILYDFGMTIDGYEWLYCSKLIRLAFLKASGGREVLPAYTTLLDMQNRDFLKRVGVKATETFAPADLEIDPRFEIVAEWADYRATASLRGQDLIMTMLFDAMETHGYRFRPDWTIELISVLGRLSARMFESVKLLLADVFPRIPINMKRKTIAVIAMLHHTAQPILDKLVELDKAEIAKTGRPLHPRQVLAFLDGHRKASGGRLGYLVAPKSA